METADIFSRQLVEEAKRFFEKAKVEKKPAGREAYLHAALLIAFAALEAHINSIANDFADRRDLNLLERSILFERNIVFDRGEFTMSQELKMYRLEDRIEFIFRRFTRKALDRDAMWWQKLKQGINLRNRLTHPKQQELINERLVEDSIQSIIDTINNLYKAVYKRPYPLAKRGLLSSVDF